MERPDNIKRMQKITDRTPGADSHENSRNHCRIQPVPQRAPLPASENTGNDRRGLCDYRHERRFHAERHAGPF